MKRDWDDAAGRERSGSVSVFREEGREKRPYDDRSYDERAEKVSFIQLLLLLLLLKFLLCPYLLLSRSDHDLTKRSSLNLRPIRPRLREPRHLRKEKYRRVVSCS